MNVRDPQFESSQRYLLFIKYVNVVQFLLLKSHWMTPRGQEFKQQHCYNTTVVNTIVATTTTVTTKRWRQQFIPNSSSFFCLCLSLPRLLLELTSSWVSRSVTNVIKLFFGGNLEFPKIKKSKKVFSDVSICSKMWKQCYFKAKL